MPSQRAHPLEPATAKRDLERLGLLDSPAEEAFDRLARLAAKVLRTPVALVTIMDENRQFFKSCMGLPEPWSTWRETPLTHSFCKHAVETLEPLIIEDAREHPLVKENLAIEDLHVVAYLGIPLIMASGHALGTFCVIDDHPRSWTADEIDTMQALTASVVTEIELRSALLDARQQAEEARRERKERRAVQQLREEAEAALALLDAIHANTPAALAFLHSDGTLTRINPTMATLLAPRPEFAGCHLGELAPELWSQLRTAVSRVAGEAKVVSAVEVCTPSVGAPPRYWLASLFSVTTTASVFLGIGLVMIEITERRRAERELEAAVERLLHAEVEKKRFTREVLRAVTQGCLHLVEPAEIPTPDKWRVELSLEDPANYPRLRHELREVSRHAGLSEDLTDELVLATGEVVTNAIKHGKDGTAAFCVTGDRVLVRVSDRGPGIRSEDLPATVLEAGFSTKVSLGMGFTMLLQLVDGIWLATGSSGTTVQIEKWLRPVEHAADPLAAMLRRFG